MRRVTALAMILALIIYPEARAQTPLSPAPAAAPDAGRVGVAAAVRGGVQLSRAGQVGSVVTSGAPVFLGDSISTDAKGNLQILLLDQTTFTIGPDSSMVIDEFVYDPKTHAGKVTATVAKGTFRFISGKIAHKKPENMNIKLPSGYIGVRGTMAMGHVEGERSTVVLTGPGSNNNTGDNQGALVVGNEVNGQIHEVGIVKTGFGTVIEGSGEVPQAPFQVPEDQIQQMTESLNPEEGPPADENEPSDSGSASEQSGQDLVDAQEVSLDMIETGDLTEALGDETDSAAQDSADESIIESNGITQLEELRTIDSGQFHYVNSNVTIYDGTGNSIGTYAIQYDIDFANRQVGGNQSKISSGNISTFGGSIIFALAHQSFASGTGDATFTYSNISSSGTCSVSCTANSVSITLNNEDGAIAASADHSLIVDKSAVLFYGAGSMDRQEGLST